MTNDKKNIEKATGKLIVFEVKKICRAFHNGKVFLIAFCLIVSLLQTAAGQSTFGLTKDPSSTKEIHVEHYIINHRLGIQTVDVTLKISGEKTLPPLDIIKNDVMHFLINYPNQEDSWEIVNKKLVAHLYDFYSCCERLQSFLSIEPDIKEPFLRVSLVSLIKGKIERQAFSFELPLSNNLGSLIVDIEYSPNSKDEEYINFMDVKERIESFFKANNSLKLSNELVAQLSKQLQQNYPWVKSFVITIQPPKAPTINIPTDKAYSSFLTEDQPQAASNQDQQDEDCCSEECQ
jgi:dihydroneopterin aldolase